MTTLNKQAKVQLIKDYLETSKDVEAGFDQYKEKSDELLELIRVNGLWQEMNCCRLGVEGVTPTYQNVLTEYELYELNP
jgi:hypothetical protein